MSASSPKRSSLSARLTEMPPRKLATITGLFWIATFITSIPAVLLYDPLLNNKDFILGAGGGDTRIFIGATLELLLIIANIGTAVAIYPLLKRQHHGLALGFVTARVMESVFIAVGVLSVLTVVTMRQDFAATDGADSAAVGAVGDALVTLQEWTFVLGPNFVVGVGNGLILGYIMFRTGLVPWRLALLGLIGGPLLVMAGSATLLDIVEVGSAWQTLPAAPEFIWELGLGLYLIVKGFRTTASTEASPAGMVDAR